MIHRPRIIFADEPTGLRDRHSGLQVMALLRGCRKQGSLVADAHTHEILSLLQEVRFPACSGHLLTLP